MIAKFPYYIKRLPNGDIDSKFKEWLIVSNIERVNVRPARVLKWSEECRGDIFLVSYVNPEKLEPDLVVDVRKVILHLESGKTLSVLFDNGVFLCNDNGKTIDHFV